MRDRKRPFPTYNEARLEKIRQELESKRIHNEYLIRIKIKETKLIAEKYAIMNGIDPQLVFNAMGLYRFNI
jgi:hypothetical protein